MPATFISRNRVKRLAFLIVALTSGFHLVEGIQIFPYDFCKIRNPWTTSIFYYLVLFRFLSAVSESVFSLELINDCNKVD